MNGEPEPDERFDPAAMFADARTEKLLRRQALHEALTGPPPEPDVAAEVELDELADAVAERLVGRVGHEPEPDPGFFANAAAAREEREAAFVAALTGLTTTEASAGAAAQGSGFDGGARASLPVRKDPEREHAALLGHLVAASRVYRSGNF